MKRVTTPPFRVSFPNVFEAVENPLNGKLEYSLVALFKLGEDLSEIEKLVEETFEAKWGPDKKKWPKNLKHPLRDQAEKEKLIDGEPLLPPGMEAGAMFCTLKSSKRPAIVDKTMNIITEKDELYAGCWARASIVAYSYDHKANKGVALGLRNIQKLKDDEVFGYASTPEDDFEVIDSDETSDLI